MPKTIRYEIHAGFGNSPKQRRVYSRSDQGVLRRVPRGVEKMLLLRYDIEQSEKERKKMRQISIAKQAAIFGAIVVLVFVIALTFALAA